MGSNLHRKSVEISIDQVIPPKRPARYGKGFAMQPKSEWHEKAIQWYIKEMYKLKGAREELLLLLQKHVSCDIIISPINKNLTVRSTLPTVYFSSLNQRWVYFM